MEAGGSAASSPIVISPDVSSSYGNGWRQLWKNFLELLLAGIICFVLTVPVGIIIGLIFSLGFQNSFMGLAGSLPFDFLNDYPWVFQITSYIINIVYFTPILYGLLFVYMTAARGDKVEFGNIFAAFKNYGNVILVGFLYVLVFNGMALLLGLITGYLWPLGVLLNIIWVVLSIIIYCRVVFVPYLLLDRKMKAIETIKASWHMTKGHGWKVFLIGLLGIPIAIAGAICLGVGIIIAGMWIMLAVGSLYHAVSTKTAPAARPEIGVQ